jgi:CrcB protein
VVVDLAPATSFPWAVFAVNVVGSLALGMAMAEEWRHPSSRVALHDGVGIGFCGGLTTFSTFAVEVVALARDGRGGLGALYLVTSVAASLAAVVLGARLLRGRAGLDLPLEGEP